MTATSADLSTMTVKLPLLRRGLSTLSKSLAHCRIPDTEHKPLRLNALSLLESGCVIDFFALSLVRILHDNVVEPAAHYEDTQVWAPSRRTQL
jgi:hypothetical protein